ncbi:MAG TPA: hypothetical protein VHU84_15520 [Lacipirellulaceae bacterium]|nr:hypothetical protein [Lacipirellulaceae bacterium]
MSHHRYSHAPFAAIALFESGRLSVACAIRTGAFAIILSGVQLLHPSSALATKFWKNSVASGNWSTSNNWSASSAAGTDNGGVPTSGEPVRIVFTDGTPRTVTYDVNAPTIGLLSVDLTGAGTSAATFSVPNNNNLTAAAIFVGGYSGTGATSGHGALNQSAGAIATSAGTDLAVGYGAGSSGTYIMSGGTFTAAQNEFVGYSGTGVFNQSGGTNTIVSTSAFFEVGDNMGATGTYNLSGSGTLTSNSSEYVGYFGAGNFNQTGGTNTTTQNLTLGVVAGSTGSYSISTGSLTVGNNLVVGSAGTGTMTIGTGGSVNVTNDLSINGSSNINLNGGTLRFNTATGLDRINFNSGTIQIHSASDATSVLTSLFGSAHVIPAGKALTLESAIESWRPGIDRKRRGVDVAYAANALQCDFASYGRWNLHFEFRINCGRPARDRECLRNIYRHRYFGEFTSSRRGIRQRRRIGNGRGWSRSELCYCVRRRRAYVQGRGHGHRPGFDLA